MSNMNLVSIIICTYRRSKNLKKAINSVINQTYKNWELIIVDDNNENSEYRHETEKLMEKYENNSKIRYIKHKNNRGGSAARNTGIRAAQGKYLAFLDDDDVYISNNLEKLIKLIQTIPNDYGACFSSYYIVSSRGIIKESQHKSIENIHKKELIKDHVGAGGSTGLFKKECFDKAGLFDEKLPARQDYDMWIRISKYYKFAFLNEPLVYIYRKNRDSTGSSSKNNFEGTKIVLNKIIDELKNYEINFQKKVYSAQYRYLGVVCCQNFKTFKLGKKYLLTSLKNELNIKTLFFFLISLLGRSFWNLMSITRSSRFGWRFIAISTN